MMPNREVPPLSYLKGQKKNIDQFLNVTKLPAALNCCVTPQPFTLKRSGRQATTELQLSDFRADTEVRRGSKAASYNVKQNVGKMCVAKQTFYYFTNNMTSFSSIACIADSTGVH